MLKIRTKSEWSCCTEANGIIKKMYGMMEAKELKKKQAEEAAVSKAVGLRLENRIADAAHAESVATSLRLGSRTLQRPGIRESAVCWAGDRNSPRGLLA